jgi:hypothetical protein
MRDDLDDDEVLGLSRAFVEQALAVVLMAVAGYCWWTYSGPYRWAAELQMKLFGSYFPMISALIVVVVPLLVIRLALYRTLAPHPSDAASAGKVHPLALGLGGLVLAGMGGIAWWDGSRMTLAPTTALAMEGGEAPPSRWLRIEGEPQEDWAVTYGEKHRQDAFVPFVSPGWTPERPVAVVVKVGRGRSLGNGPVQGVVSRAGLPGPVRVVFEEGGLPLDRRHLVIELGGDPDKEKVFGAIFGGIGALLVVIALIAQLRSAGSSSSPPITPRGPSPGVPGGHRYRP